MYGLAAVVVLVVATQADWPKIQKNFFNTEIAADMFPEVITSAVKNTALYTALSFVLGMVLALALALCGSRASSRSEPSPSATSNSSEGFRRSLPCSSSGSVSDCVQRIPYSGWCARQGSVGLALVAGAYMAETIRAGIEAVPKGQTEAARSLGMSQTRTMFTIILPQAFRIIIPPLTNELVLLIKDTSLFFILGSTPGTKELTKFARDFMNAERNATPLTVVAILYLLITLPLTFLVRRLERSAAKAR